MLSALGIARLTLPPSADMLVHPADVWKINCKGMKGGADSCLFISPTYQPLQHIPKAQSVSIHPACIFVLLAVATV